MTILISDLINEAEVCLKSLGLSDETIRDYRRSAFHPLELLLNESKYVDSTDILLQQEKYFYTLYDEGKISKHTLNWRIRGIRILAEIYETGKYEWKVFRKNTKPKLPEPFSSVLESFLLTKECSLKRKNITESICSRFLISIIESGIDSFDGITSENIRDFITCISETRAKSMDDVVYTLRGFFRYLCENDLYHSKSWMLLAAPRCRDYHVLANVSKKEISTLLDTVDTDTNDGKRDFAILSLAIVSGLRAGDIASLKLQDIDWKQNEIRLIQGKTAEQLVLPVPKNVLHAIADYILNGRPETQSTCIFVRHLAPFNGLQDGVSIARIFRKYQKKAGLQHKVGDGKTLHGIRRALGTEMTASGIPIETVAQVLGHKDIRPTRRYIAADMQGMRKCVLGFDSLGGAENGSF